MSRGVKVRIKISDHALLRYKQRCCPDGRGLSKKDLRNMVAQHLAPVLGRGVRLRAGAIQLKLHTEPVVIAVLRPAYVGWEMVTCYLSTEGENSGDGDDGRRHESRAEETTGILCDL